MLVVVIVADVVVVVVVVVALLRRRYGWEAHGWRYVGTDVWGHWILGRAPRVAGG